MASSGRPRLSRYSERYPLTEADGTNSELWTDYDDSDDNAGGVPLYSTVRRYDVPIWQTWNDDAYSVEEENRQGPHREPSYLQSQISPQFPQSSLPQRPLPEISHRASAPYVEPVEKGTTSAGSWNAAFPFKHRARNTKCNPPPLAADTQHLMSTDYGAEESDARYNYQASRSRDGAEDAALTNPWHRPVYAPGDRRQVDEDEEWDQQLLWQHSDGVRPNRTTHVPNPWHVPTGGKRQTPRMGVKLDTRNYTGGRQTGTSGVHPVGTYDCFDPPTASSSGDSRWNSHSSADMVLLPKSAVKKQLLAGRRSDVLCGVLVVLLLLLLIGALPLLYWKLDPSQTGHPVQVQASFRITNWNFSDALNDKDSTEFKKKQELLCDQLTKTADIHCRVTQFRKGSVICDFVLEGSAPYQRREVSLQANIIDYFVEAALSSNFTGGDIDPSSIAVSGSSRPMCSESKCGADKVCVERPPSDYTCYSLDPERITSPDRVAPADIVTSTTPTTTTTTPTSTTTTPTTTTITPTTTATTPSTIITTPTTTTTTPTSTTTTPTSTTTTPTNTTTTLSTTTTTGTTATTTIATTTTTLTTTSATPDTTTTTPDTTTTTPDATTSTPDATTSTPDTTVTTPTTTPTTTTTTLTTTTNTPSTTTTTLDATTTTPGTTTTTPDTTTTTPDATTTTPDTTTTTPDATTTDTTTTTPYTTTTTPDATTTTPDATTTTPDTTATTPTTTPDTTTTTLTTTTNTPEAATTTPSTTTTTLDATTTTPGTTTTTPDTTTTTPDATTTTPDTTTTTPDATTTDTTTTTPTTTPDTTTTTLTTTTTTPDTATTTPDATTSTPDTTVTTPTTTPTTTTTTPATTTTTPTTRTSTPSTTTTTLTTTTTTPDATTTTPDTSTTTPDTTTTTPDATTTTPSTTTTTPDTATTTSTTATPICTNPNGKERSCNAEGKG